jgi:hypothetical protein
MTELLDLNEESNEGNSKMILTTIDFKKLSEATPASGV